ncbi:uncharacterized protein [Argopecten irradians]|uniref:uncharacterized protein n=1 Tax=Argopecten irradians TaxID=31199 RepID=UPI0037113FB8
MQNKDLNISLGAVQTKLVAIKQTLMEFKTSIKGSCERGWVAYVFYCYMFIHRRGTWRGQSMNRRKQEGISSVDTVVPAQGTSGIGGDRDGSLSTPTGALVNLTTPRSRPIFYNDVALG